MAHMAGGFDHDRVEYSAGHSLTWNVGGAGREGDSPGLETPVVQGPNSPTPFSLALATIFVRVARNLRGPISLKLSSRTFARRAWERSGPKGHNRRRALNIV